MITTVDPITTTRAAALFLSTLSTSDNPTTAEVVGAIERALRTHGGSHGCTADVAQAYGDHPELAAPRMRWARRLVEVMFPEPSGYALAA
jgi:hypothetical protein